MYMLLTLNQDISKFGNVFLTPCPTLKQQIFLIGTKVSIMHSKMSLSHPLLSDFRKVSASRLCHWPNVGTVRAGFCLWGQHPWLWAGASTNPALLCCVTVCQGGWKAVQKPAQDWAPHTLCPNCSTPGCCELALWELLSLQPLFGALVLCEHR